MVPALSLIAINYFQTVMAQTLDNYFAFNQAAMSLKTERLEVISGNIANASTPGFKAKDLDFASLLKKSFGKTTSPEFNVEMLASHSSHMGYSNLPKWMNVESGINYTVPLSPSLDDNTVEIGVEQSKYGRAVIDYQASLQFMESKISGLRKVLKGE
jgi:flagellar basal-body rod protein FlgB